MSSLIWLVVGAATGIAVLLFAIMDRAKQEDRTSRHIQHGLSPFAGITITRREE